MRRHTKRGRQLRHDFLPKPEERSSHERIPKELVQPHMGFLAAKARNKLDRLLGRECVHLVWYRQKASSTALCSSTARLVKKCKRSLNGSLTKRQVFAIHGRLRRSAQGDMERAAAQFTAAYHACSDEMKSK